MKSNYFLKSSKWNLQFSRKMMKILLIEFFVAKTLIAFPKALRIMTKDKSLSDFSLTIR